MHAQALLIALILALGSPQAGQPGQRRGVRPPGSERGVPDTGTLAPATGQAAQAVAPARPESGPEEPPVVTHHEVTVGGRTLQYTATAGRMPLKNAEGVTEARMFFIAYTLDGVPAGTKRPLLFAFNGGPGSASVWLHLGAIGPRRVDMLPEGGMPQPPARMVDNEATWLDAADLVFIDPIGTGYSRAARPELGKNYWSVQGDIDSVAEFIRLYLTRYQRWGSPLFIAGESYGTTRAAGLSGHLIDNGIALNGVILISTVLAFQALDFSTGNDLPYVLYLPTYTASAWYHRKLAPDLERDLPRTLADVEHWAITDYQTALTRGDSMTPEERRAVALRLSRYSGLSLQYVENHDLRVPIFAFTKELLRDRNEIVGRYDSRIIGKEPMAAGEGPSYDPSLSVARPAFTALFNEYVRADLGYRTDDEYYVLGGGIGRWDWGTAGRGGYPETASALRNAFGQNPYMKLFVAKGYYDLATPFYSVDYTLNQLQLDPTLRANITTANYGAGHMMYLRQADRDKLHRDVVGFIANALTARPIPGHEAPEP